MLFHCSMPIQSDAVALVWGASCTQTCTKLEPQPNLLFHCNMPLQNAAVARAWGTSSKVHLLRFLLFSKNVTQGDLRSATGTTVCDILGSTVFLKTEQTPFGNIPNAHNWTERHIPNAHNWTERRILSNNVKLELFAPQTQNSLWPRFGEQFRI